MRLDDQRDIQSVKPTWSVLIAELNTRILPSPEVND